MRTRKQKLSRRAKKLQLSAKFPLSTLLFSALLVLGVSYIFATNAIATKGFEIQELEKRVDNLREEQKHLAKQAMNMQSMSEVRSRLANLDLVPVDTIDYVSSSASVVAVK